MTSHRASDDSTGLPLPQTLATPNRKAWRLLGVIVLAGLAAVVSETVAPTLVGELYWPVNVPVALGGIVLTAIILRASGSFWELPWSNPLLTLALAGLGCLIAGTLGGVGWPNSGDENSFVFLADMIRHGQVFALPPPDPVLLKTFHVITHDDRLYSPYAPGWSAALALFDLVGATSLAAPVFTLAGGVALWRTLRLVCPAPMVNPLLSLALLNPFTLFLGGSFFAQGMVFASVATIIWLQLVDDTEPRWWRKLAIGALFGLLQLTRYEIVAVVGLVYVVDRLVIRRWSAIRDGVVVALGFVPFAALLLAYNAAVTGNPLQLPATWAQDSGNELGSFGVLRSLVYAVAHNVFWTDELFVYGGMALTALALIAVVAKIWARTIRFYDALGPCTLLFYSIQPFTGGHQYGPRYWYLAFPFLALTVGSASLDGPHKEWTSVSRVAGAALAFSIVTFCGLLVADGRYLAARRAVYAAQPPQLPALVLLPSRDIAVWPWQASRIRSYAVDFTRNGLTSNGPVLYGLLDLPDSTARACRLGRTVYRWQEPGSLHLVPCS